MNQFLKRAQELEETLITVRRVLHQMPEIGMELPKTSAYVMEQLTQMGIESKRIAGDGVTACIGRAGGKVFLLRGDMDALSMQEDSGLAFAAQGANAHTCGHDIHTAMILGAARLLKEREEELCGQVKLMFQPSEENLQGAASMLEAGILDNPKVDAGMAMHVFPDYMHAGQLGWRAGVVMASSDSFRITVTGKAGHGAMPQNAVDTLNIAAHIILALQEINAREVDPQDPLVLTICTIVAGELHNAFPQTAVMSGSIRAYSEKNRSHAKMRLQEICTGIAQLFRGSCLVEFTAETPPTYSDPTLTNEIISYAEAVMPELIQLPRQMGSEDFALVTQQIPCVFFGLGAGGVEDIYNQGGMHNPKVVFNEESVIYGTATMANCAYEWLKAHDTSNG